MLKTDHSTLGRNSEIGNPKLFYEGRVIGVYQIPDRDDQNKYDPEDHGNDHPVLGIIGLVFLIFGFHCENK